MKIAIFSTHHFKKNFLQKENNNRVELFFLETWLNEGTAILVKGCKVALI